MIVKTRVIRSQKMALQINDAAPDFVAETTEGNVRFRGPGGRGVLREGDDPSADHGGM